MKRLIAALMAAALVALTAGCGAQDDPTPAEPQGTGEIEALAGTLNLHLGGEPESLDPAFATTGSGGGYAVQLFEGLMSLDRDLALVGGVAEEWELGTSEGGLPQYTFTLRQDARWWDGQAVTAQDFVYAWQRVLDPQLGADSAYLLYPIYNARLILEGETTEKADGTQETTRLDPDDLGVRAVDDHTLEVTLEGPTPYFLQLLTLPVFFPVRQDAVEQSPVGWSGTPETCLGNGPYRLSRWNHDRSMTMDWNDTYWGADEASPRQLHFVLSQEDGALLADFRRGALLVAASYPPVERDTLLEEGLLREIPRLGTYYYSFNTQKEPLDNALLRRAISLAVDRQLLADSGLFGRLPARGLVPQGVADQEGAGFRTPDNALLELDLTQARELLTQAEYPQGQGLPPLVALTNDTPGHVQMLTQVAKMVQEELGITITVKALPWEEFQAAKAEGEWDLVRSGMMGPVSDPYAYLDAFASDSPQNDAWYENKDYDKALAGSRTAKDAQERLEDLRRLEELLVLEDAAVLPLTFYSQELLVCPDLTGLVVSPAGYPYLRWAEVPAGCGLAE